MSNLTYTDVPIDLIVNKLSKEKYDSLVNANLINDTEIYLVDEDNLDAASGVISNVGTPISPTDAANKSYVDTVSSNIVNAFPDNIVTNNAGNNTGNLAIGTGAQATGGASIATGYCAQATSYDSIAAGHCAQATDSYSIATGNHAQATGGASIATGYYAQAKSYDSIATGSGAKALSGESIAIGYNANANNNDSLAIGANTQANGVGTIAIGSTYHCTFNPTIADANTPIVIGSGESSVSAAQIRVTKEGVMTVGGKEVGASLFETKTFTTDSQTGETDLMVIAKQENGVQPRLHAGDKDIHGVTGFSNESTNYTGQRYILDWDLAMSNDTSYLMGATKWTGSRRIGGNHDILTTTFVQPLIPANTGTTSSVLPYALPCFENSPVYWNGHIIWNNSLCASTGKYTAQAKDITIPWDNAGTDVSSIEFVVNNNKTDPANWRNSLAIGYCAKADLCHSVAVGPLADATGCNAIAIGTGAKATDHESIATGNNAKAEGYASIATGYAAEAGYYSIATGYNTQAGYYSIATGCGAQATGCHSIAMGPGAKATGYYSIATGNNAKATGTNSIATGSCAEASDYSTATGDYAKATGDGSIATGYRAQATGSHSIATGSYAQAISDCSIATGYYAKAQDAYTIAIGASKSYDYSVSASTAVPIVIGSDHSSVSAAQITVTSAGILNVGGVEMAKKSDALITIKRWDD